MTEQPTSSPPDITARLRREAQDLWFEGGRDSDRQLMLEAANEIERLRLFRGNTIAYLRSRDLETDYDLYQSGNTVPAGHANPVTGGLDDAKVSKV
jgi:hypothetical protein